MSLFQRDRRYLTTHLWVRWATILYLALPIVGFAVLAFPGLLLADANRTGLAAWFNHGRGLCGMALCLPLAAGLLIAPFVGIRLVLCETEEGTLEVLQTTPLGGLEIFLEKLGVALWLWAPFLAMTAPVLAFGWVHGWIGGAEALLGLALGAGVTAFAAALAMLVAALTRAAEVAYAAAGLLLVYLVVGLPPFTDRPDSPVGWLLFAAPAAAFQRFTYHGDFPVTPGDWAGALAWCGAATVLCALVGGRLLFAGDVARRRRAVHLYPVALAAAAAGWLAVEAVRSPQPGATAAGLAALAVVAVVLWRHARRFTQSDRLGLGRFFGRGPILRKEIAFYETGGLRTLRDALLLLLLAYGLWLAAHPLFWHHVGGPAARLFQACTLVFFVLGVTLGATSLTLERSRNTFELLLLTPLAPADILAGKRQGILLYLAPVVGAVVLLAGLAGGATPTRAAGAVLAAACLVPWVRILVSWGITVGAGAKTNGQAIAACFGIFWIVRFGFDVDAPRGSGWGTILWHTLKATLGPYFWSQQSLSLGADFPDWHPLGFWGGLALFAACTWGLDAGVAGLANGVAVKLDPWGDVRESDKKDEEPTP